MSYLNETNPEIFFVVPRPGGIANIELPEPDIPIGPKGSKGTLKSSRSMRSTRSGRSRSKSIMDAKFFTSTPGVTSREHRIQHALATVPWVLFDDQEEEDEDPANQQPNPLQDTIDMLAIAITTIMLLAAGHKDISKDHLRWTLSYLECVKDEYGNNPPNIKGIMNHIKMIDGNLESFNEQELATAQSEKETEGATAAGSAGAAPAEAAPAEAAPAEAAPAEAAPAEPAATEAAEPDEG